MVMQVELQATCSALGYQEGQKYVKEPDCLETVKDLIRFLKREDETCDIRQQLGHAQIIQNDLIPLIKHYRKDRALMECVIRRNKLCKCWHLAGGDNLTLDLTYINDATEETLTLKCLTLDNCSFLAAAQLVAHWTDETPSMYAQVRGRQCTYVKKVFPVEIAGLMVNLTNPSILCFNHLPEDKTIRNHYMEVESHLQGYKEAFIDEELFAVLTEKLGDLLKLDWENRHEDDKMFIERLLILVRNILHVPPNPEDEKRTDDDASIHDQVIWALHVSGMEDLLLYIASSDEERQYCVHVLEIISLMFREQTPELLAHAGIQRSMTEKEKDQRELELAREKEKSDKLAMVMKKSTRHSRFGGTFVLKNMKSISDRDVIYHKPLKDTNSVNFDQNKKPKKQPKNRQAIKDVELVRRSTLSIRLALKDFCVQFLESCYNPLMRAVKDTLMREKSQDHDETYYLWAMRFFMEFCRDHSGKVELVSETMSVPSFHYIYNNLLTYYEMIMTEKKEGKIWARRVHLALKAYQELLMTLYSMDKSKNQQIRESSKVIKSNVFYMMEFRDIFLTLLRKFDESKQSRSYLKDLVETTHLFLKMLEAMCKQTSHLVVQRKKKKSNTRKKKQKEKATPNTNEVDPELEDVWDDVSSELSALIQGRADVPTDVTPFDAASEVEVDQQRVDAMIRIQQSLRSKEGGQALALFRSAREVWPDRDEFGRVDITPEDEFMALREIFFSNIAAAVTETPQEEPSQEEDEELEEEEEVEVSASEQEFNFKDYLRKYAKPQILKAHVVLLADFQKNSGHSNHCAIKMLHRIGVELGMMGMLFQASLFRVFQKLLLSPVANSSHFQEMMKFSVHVIRHFVIAAPKNDKIFMELLFWKSAHEAVDIVDGYGTSENTVKQIWTEDQEQELQRLYEEYRDVEDGRDTVDHIMDDITDGEKTRGQIVRQLKRQGLIESAKDLKRRMPSSRPTGWTEGQILELRDLFDTYRESNDPVGNIVSNLEVKRSKLKVIEKIVELELVEDRKELYKKRSGKEKHSTNNNNSDSEDDGDRDYFEEAEFMETSEHVNLSGDESEVEDRGGDNSETSKSPQQLDTLLQQLLDSGYRGQIEWIQRGLTRTAEDRAESDDSEPVPIVPLTEESEDAMEDNSFTNLLKKIGLSPPASEQERFWRIPADLSADDLKTICSGLEMNEENQFVHLESLKQFVENRSQPVRQKKSPQKTKPPPKNKKTKKVENERTTKLAKLASKLKHKPERSKPKRRERTEMDGFLASDSDERQKEKPRKKKKSTKKVQKVVSDSDSEEDVPLSAAVKGANSEPKSRLKRPLGSDSEDSDSTNLQIDLSDDDKPLSKRIRKAVIHDSESEDDNVPEQNDNGSQLADTLIASESLRLRLSSQSDVPEQNDNGSQLADTIMESESLHLRLSSQSDVPEPNDNGSLPADTMIESESLRLRLSSDEEEEITVSHTKKRKHVFNESEDESSRGSEMSSNLKENQPSKRPRPADVGSEVIPRADDLDESSSEIKEDMSSDEDTPLVLLSQPPDESSQDKTPLDTFPATLLSVPAGESDSDDDHIPLKKVLKRRKIDSDEED